MLNNSLKEKAKEHGKKVIKSMATYYSNVACPLVFYQPKKPDAVKKLRKF